MSWIKWWSVAEGIDIHGESGDGYFSLTSKQARPNWFAFAFGLIFAAICFSIAAHMSNSTPPEPIMFWFFLVFGIIGFLFCFGGFLLAYYRRIATACTVSDGRIVWAQETGLPERFDHKGEIEIASIHSINVEYWHDGSVRGFKFDMGDDTKMIEASLGPALCGQWSDDFLDAVLFWNPEISGVTKRAGQGADTKPENVTS